MSHIVTLKTRVQDPAAVAAACQRLGLDPPRQGTAQLFSGDAEGLVVQLPGWQYPVVIDTASGVARYASAQAEAGRRRGQGRGVAPVPPRAGHAPGPGRPALP